MTRFRSALAFLCIVGICAGQSPSAADQQVRSRFRVRYVASDAVYVEGGRSAGLSEGTRLVIKSQPSEVPLKPIDPQVAASDETVGLVATLRVVSVAETSAVCEVVSKARTLKVGDVATLPQDEIEKLVTRNSLSNTRMYPAVVSFTEGDPLDEDVRDEIPRPPLPEVNQARGRFGMDYSTTRSAGLSSSQLGFVFRTDITRIAGTYWNLSGYYRGGLSTVSSRSQQTMQDLINRTYHMKLTYDNPGSRWVLGFGRMYLPWASSLDTIDGGYFGRKVSHGGTVGVFAGLAPDPTSWSYDPNRRIGGAFVSYDGGTFENIKWSTTTGFGVNLLGWQLNRPFVFGENTVTYKRVFSLYHSYQIDRPKADPSLPAVNVGVGRSFFSLRIQPHPRVSFDLNHAYFRDLPTFDPQLVGTGLLDKYLFQGVSGGVRVEAPRHITFYTNIGRSNSSRDTKNSWNTMFGISKSQLWKTGLRADVRYSKFNSSFAQGSYRSLSLSRNLRDNLRLELQGGTQSFVSPLTKDTGSHFLNSNIEYAFGPHYFFQGGFTAQRGGLWNYNQVFCTFGYRFDNRGHRKAEVANATHN